MTPFDFEQFEYLVAWAAMTAVIVTLLTMSEVLYGFFLFLAGGSGGNTHPFTSIAASASAPIVLSENASRRSALLLPILALAALFPACASISFLTFSPLIDNGGDLLQILLFVVLSEVFAAAAICAQGTKRAQRCASRLFCESVRLMIVMMAAFSSLAIYFSSLGAQGNLYSLTTYYGSLHLKYLDVRVLAAIAVLVVLALSHMSVSDEGGSDGVFSEMPPTEYDGIQRAMLQIWIAFKSFLAAMLITQIFFPWFLIGDSSFLSAQIQALILFWLAVIATRTFGVMACRKARSFLEAQTSPAFVALMMLCMTCAAVSVIYYEAYKAAADAY